MTNRYPGINPHLNSFLQHKTGWKGFHTHHLAKVSKMIDPLLPDAYYIADEESLQIGIYDRFAWNLVQTEEPEYISSLVIYRLEDGVFPGVPVTRIELLSPANKSPGSHAEKYRLKREETLRSGLRLVEIDYLHQQPPITGAIPNYQTEQLNAFPYYIAVSDPRPSLDRGLMKVYGFGVLDNLPVLDIPLDEDDIVRVDFGALYQLTFNSLRLFRDILVDYRREPVNFDTYSPTDQTLIREYMQSLTSE